MDRLLQDLGFGVRMLRKSPGFSALAVLTFALGVGVNVAIFSVVDAVVLRGLGVADADRIVRIFNQDPAHRDSGTESSWIERQRFDAETRAFAGVAAADRRAVIVRDGDDPRRLLTNVVSENYFDVLRVAPAAGRVFTASEFAGRAPAPMVLISYDYWQRQYSADRQIVGKTIVASDTACTVIGVLPRTFRGTELFLNPDLYMPVSTWLTMNPADRVRLERPQSRNLDLFGRLRDGVTPAQAAAALAGVQQQLAAEYPAAEANRRIDVKADREGRGDGFASIGWMLFSVAALVLMIACVNIANLLLVRGEMRRVEIVTRVALGASRGRTVRQLVTETCLLAAIGAAGALLLAAAVIRVLPSLMPQMAFPIGFDFRLDARVLGFGGVMSLFCVALSGILPAFTASNVSLVGPLKDGRGSTGSRGRWRDAMVVGQVAVTVVLLVAAGLMTRTLMAVRNLDPGFDPRANMVIATLDTRKLNLTQEHAYYRAAIERLGALPGVQSATVASRIPMWGSGGGAATLAWLPGLPPADRDGLRIGFAVVSPNYFSTLGTRLLRGRPIGDRDSENAPPSVVLNQSAAHLLFPNDDAIGKRFKVNGANGREVEVVGIAQDGRYLELTEQQRAYMFMPLFQEQQIFGSRWGAEVLVVRTAADAASQAGVVRQTLRAVDSNVPVTNTTTMEDHIRYALYADRLMVQLVGSMGVIGLVLAAIGLFGVISYSVARRRREIGVRIALGANRADVVRLVLARASWLAGIGIATGLVLALAGGQAIASMVYGVSVRDPFTFAVAALTMAAVALLAAAIPVRRAVSVDPINALRSE